MMKTINTRNRREDAPIIASIQTVVDKLGNILAKDIKTRVVKFKIRKKVIICKQYNHKHQKFMRFCRQINKIIQ